MNAKEHPWPSLNPAALIALALVVAGVVALFAPTFSLLLHRWEIDPNYSHGFLVAPVSLLLAAYALICVGRPQTSAVEQPESAHPTEQCQTEVKGEVVSALLHIGSGLVIHCFAELISWPLLDFVALVAVLRGVALAVGGKPYAAAVDFPLLFLVFMFPWPTPWMARAALWLQEGVAIVSAAVLDLFIVCYRQGTSLHLAGVKEPLVIAEECSGLRQIVAFLALAALMGQFFGRSIPFRLTLLVIAVPVAVLANVIRVLLMAAGAVLYGTKWIDSWLHHAPATFSLPMGIALMFLLMWVMEKLWPTRRPDAPPPTNPAEAPCPSPDA